MIMATVTSTITSTVTSTITSTVTSTVTSTAHDAAADADVRQLDDIEAEFLALIYSDPELLRDEFEELVAAAWSGRPPPTAAPGRGSGHPPDRPTVLRGLADGRRPAAQVGGARDGGARTRSPPDLTGALPHDERRTPPPRHSARHRHAISTPSAHHRHSNRQD